MSDILLNDKLQVASERFISDAAMEATLRGRADFAGTLADMGFLPPGYPDNPRAAPGLDEHSDNARVVKAAICAGFYPNVLRVDHPPAVFKEVLGGAMEADSSPARLKFFDRHKGAPFLLVLY